MDDFMRLEFMQVRHRVGDVARNLYRGILGQRHRSSGARAMQHFVQRPTVHEFE